MLHADCQTEGQLLPSDVCDGRPFKVYYSIISAACAPTHHCPYHLDIMTKMQPLRNDRFPPSASKFILQSQPDSSVS